MLHGFSVYTLNDLGIIHSRLANVVHFTMTRIGTAGQRLSGQISGQFVSQNMLTLVNVSIDAILMIDC